MEKMKKKEQRKNKERKTQTKVVNKDNENVCQKKTTLDQKNRIIATTKKIFFNNTKSCL